MKAVILKNEIADSELKWRIACEKKGISFAIVDISSHDWLEKIVFEKPDILLTRPSGLTAPFKIMYDERLQIAVRELNIPCFPTLPEVLIYENKKYFSYWLKANKIPHPQTHVFYKKEEALRRAQERTSVPQVPKNHVGRLLREKKILHHVQDLEQYILNTFSGKGASKRVGPNLKKGRILQRAFRLLLKPTQLKNKVDVYKARALDVQKDFVLFQEHIPHTFEWRVVRLGNSFFAHKKMMQGEMTSGSLLKNYGNPPLELLDFVEQITDKHHFHSQAVDIFESPQGYLVNEMQCIFGQSDAFQMKVDGKIGRYIHSNNQWIFEEGDFNTNESYDLRLAAALDYLKEIKK